MLTKIPAESKGSMIPNPTITIYEKYTSQSIPYPTVEHIFRILSSKKTPFRIHHPLNALYPERKRPNPLRIGAFRWGLKGNMRYALAICCRADISVHIGGFSPLFARG